MKRTGLLTALLLILTTGPVLAQEDISGTWQGMLPVGPDTTLEIHFVLTRAGDGSYSTVLTSPDPAGIQNVPATSTSFDGSRLVLTVDGLSGRYEGTLANGSFSGNWSQQGTDIPLELVPYVERTLSAEAREALRGSWVGELSIQTVTLAIVFRFEDNEAGEFVGFLDSPDQGANGVPVANIQLDGDQLKFTIPQISGDYKGTLSGDSIDGTFSQVGQAMELDMSRGQYQQRGIEMSQEAIDRLEGSWVGRVQNAAGGNLTIVFRFESIGDGSLAAFLDSPDQNVEGIPMTELVLDGDQLSFVVPAAQASFTATLSAAGMDGTWAQGNSAQPVTMTPGEYTPVVAALDLSDAAMQQLAGAWHGTMGPLDLVIRFETNDEGTRLAFLDVPAQGVAGLAIAAAELTGDQVTIRIETIGATFTGTLAGAQMEGNWQQGTNNNPLTLTRDP